MYYYEDLVHFTSFDSMLLWWAVVIIDTVLVRTELYGTTYKHSTMSNALAFNHKAQCVLVSRLTAHH